MRFVHPLGLVVVTAACSGGTDNTDDTTSYNCADEDRADEFVVGLEKNGLSGKLVFKLLEATPAPPSRGNNAWILQVTSQGTAAPVTGATMVVTPFMPDHQHGSPIVVGIEPMPEAGNYKLSPVNLWMPGLWETKITAQNGQETDAAVFSFCLSS